MSDLETLKAEMSGQLGLIKLRLDAQEKRTDENHRQNRRDIHEFRGWMQTVTDKLHDIDIKMVRLGIYVSLCGAAGGAGAAFLSKFIEHLWH